MIVCKLLAVDTPFARSGLGGKGQTDVLNGVSTYSNGMYADKIRETLFQIAELSINPDAALLIRQLGELMHLQFTTQRDSIATLNALILQLKQTQEEKATHIIDRTHNLSNRFMAVESKVDESVELLDMRLAEILSAITDAAK